MSYYDRDRGYNNHHRNRNGPRINESEVPESKHTIFIRGLSGDVTQDEVKDYIEDRIGKITFDFVKISQDRTKIFLAARFESREDAKEFMKTYQDRDFLNHRCQLSWFRDIRRYCAYQQSKAMNNRRDSPRRRRRTDSDSSRNKSRSRSRGSDRSRSTDKNRSRSVSRSASRSRSRSKSRSRSSRRDSRSRSPVSRPLRKDKGDSVPMEFSDSDNDAKSKNSKSKKNKRSYSPEDSDGEWKSDEEKKSKPRKSRKVSDTNGMSPISDHSRNSTPTRRRSSSNKSSKKDAPSIPSIPLPPKPSAASSSPSVFIPPPSLQNEDSIILPKPIVVNKEIKFNLKVEDSPVFAAAANAVQNTRFSVGLEDEGVPRTIIKDGFMPPPTPPEFPKAAVAAALPPPPIPPPITVRSHYPASGFVPVEDVKYNPQSSTVASVAPIHTSNSNSYQNTTYSSNNNGQLDHSPIPPVPERRNMEVKDIKIKQENSIDYPTTNKIFGHLDEFQNKILSSIKFVPKEEEEDDASLSTLRLSSFATEVDVEEEKKLERELVLSKLTDEQNLRFNVKKKQFETAFRNDCETYAIVTRALLAKDESLENGLKMALVENMEDLYKKMMQRVDDFLETLVK